MIRNIFKPTCLENCSVFRDLRARSALALRLFTLGRLVPASESEKGCLVEDFNIHRSFTYIHWWLFFSASSYPPRLLKTVWAPLLCTGTSLPPLPGQAATPPSGEGRTRGCFDRLDRHLVGLPARPELLGGLHQPSLRLLAPNLSSH